MINQRGVTLVFTANNSGVSPMSFVTKKVKKWINENLITNSKPTE